MPPCAFCEIIADTREASIVYDDDRVLAFMDIFPINPGHTLVIPKTHGASLVELDPELGAEVFKVAMRVEQAIRQSGIPCDGTNLYLADGHAAGQEVFHLHLHVIPRLVGDGSGFRFSSVNRTRPGRATLDGFAGRIRAKL